MDIGELRLHIVNFLIGNLKDVYSITDSKGEHKTIIENMFDDVELDNKDVGVFILKYKDRPMFEVRITSLYE